MEREVGAVQPEAAQGHGMNRLLVLEFLQARAWIGLFFLAGLERLIHLRVRASHLELAAGHEHAVVFGVNGGSTWR